MDKKLVLKKISDKTSCPFAQLQQLYEFEFSSVTKNEVNELGFYDPEKLEDHWSFNGYDIYVAYNDKQPIGFAVINMGSMVDNNPSTRDVAEFFVMPSYRKLNVGKWMAFALFDLYPGKWEIRQLQGLDGARKFWVRVINEYTKGNFEEIHKNDHQWKGTVQVFWAGEKSTIEPKLGS